MRKFDKIVVIGASAGGIVALRNLFSSIEKECPFPVLVVLHRMKNIPDGLSTLLMEGNQQKVIEAYDKILLEAGRVYLAPANYHLLVERDHSISLSTSEKVNYSRPSIDVTFVNVAEVFGNKAVGIILTGANSDGSAGLETIGRHGGVMIVQDPAEAYISIMPESALIRNPEAKKMKLSEIAQYISDHV